MSKKLPVKVTVYEKHVYRFLDTTATCSAHGQAMCVACARPDTGRCQCEVYAETGMHWDTCPGRR